MPAIPMLCLIRRNLIFFCKFDAVVVYFVHTQKTARKNSIIHSSMFFLCYIFFFYFFFSQNKYKFRFLMCLPLLLRIVDATQIAHRLVMLLKAGVGMDFYSLLMTCLTTGYVVMFLLMWGDIDVISPSAGCVFN